MSFEGKLFFDRLDGISPSRGHKYLIGFFFFLIKNISLVSIQRIIIKNNIVVIVI